MSTDYSAFEREFLVSLKADTGRDLEEWMAAIAAQDLPHRNDIIDWLRQQGFMFARASWLERIHNNGGRPIYAVGYAAQVTGETSPPPAPVRSGAPIQDQDKAPEPAEPARVAPPTLFTATATAPDTAASGPSTGPVVSPPAIPGRPGIVDPQALDATLARAKAYRPLARYLIERLQQAIPQSTVSAEKTLVTFANDEPFAVLSLSAKELRLGLDLGEAPPDRHFTIGRIAGAPHRFAHVAILTDARQVTAELMERIRHAAATCRSV